MRRLMSIVLTVGLAGTLLAGCSSPQKPAETATAAAATTAAGSEAETTVAAGEKTEAGDAALKIAIVSSPSGVDDGSFN